MTIWHDDDSFWESFAPFMFHEERLSGTAAEIDLLLELVDLAPGTAVLDLGCGPGRHSLELARRGFQVAGVDRTAYFLQLARDRAQDEGLDVEYIQDDMRQFKRAESYDLVINLFTSFGYFEEAAHNMLVLQNIYSSLRPGAVFVMELSGKEVLARTFSERNWQELDGVILLEERRVVENWRRLWSRWTLISGNERQQYEFTHWCYSAVELQQMLDQAGFEQVRIFGGLGGGPYDQNARRLTAVAVRPS